MSAELNVFGLVPDSIVDGPHLRYSVFVQGCPHACKGCHNPESHEFGIGETYSVDEIFEDIRSNKLVHDVTFSGGEPFAQPKACAALARKLKDEGYGIWAFSGYTYEQLLDKAEADDDIALFLEALDVLVDGPFIEAQKSIELDWKGSKNQRVIDLAATRRAGRIVEWKRNDIEFDRPLSW